MKKTFLFIPLLLLLFFPETSFAHSSPAGKIKLRLILNEGDIFKIKTQVDQDISQVLMGQPQNIRQSIGIFYQFKVIEAKAGLYSVEVTYDRTTFDTEGLLGSVHFDSDEKTEEIPSSAIGYASMVGQKFKMVINSRGEVKAVDGIDEMLEHMVGIYAQKYPNTDNGIAEKLKKQYGDQNMISTMQQMMAIYPEKKVKIGDEWEKTYSINTGFSLQVTNKYKLTDIQDNKAQIEIFSKIASDPSESVDLNSFDLFYEVAGHQEGKLTLNTINGWTTQSSISQDLSGEVTMEGESLPEPQSWPINISTESIISSN